MPTTKCNQGNEPRSMLQNRGCCSFLGAQPIEKEIHTLQRSSSKKFNQKSTQPKKSESKVLDTYPHLTPRNQEKTAWTFIVTTWNHSWPNSLCISWPQTGEIKTGLRMEEISPKIWEGDYPTVLTQGGDIYHPWISMISSFWANTSNTSASKEIWNYAIETIETVTHTHTKG